jgi:hypothetical protein
MLFIPKPEFYFDVYKTCKELLIISNNEHINKIKDELKDQTNVQLMPSDTIYSQTLIDLCSNIPDLHSVNLHTYAAKSNVSPSPSIIDDETLLCLFLLSESGSLKAYMAVDGEKKYFEDSWIIFDSSRDYTIFNKNKTKDIKILSIRIKRPDNIPRGISQAVNKEDKELNLN